jgi:hypothetical protein
MLAGFMRRVALGVAAFLGMMVLAACALPSPSPMPFSLHAVNLDGPTVELAINGQKVATLKCNSSVVVEPGGSLPSLPWSIEVRTPAGLRLENGQVDVFAPAAPMGLLVRGSSVLIGVYPMSYGPAPLTPCPN